MALLTETDDGYVGYIERAHDPGYSLIFATILFCIISYCSLPFLVALGTRLNVKNQDTSSPTRRPKEQKGSKVQHAEESNNSNGCEDYFDPLFGTSDGPPLAVDTSILSAGSAHSLAASVSSKTSIHSFRARKKRQRARNKRAMEKRLAWDEVNSLMQRYDGYVDDKDVHHDDETIKRHGNNIAGKVSSSVERPRGRDASPERSFMGPLDQDAVSIDDAASNFVATSHFTKKLRLPTLITNEQQNENNDDLAHDQEDNGIWDYLLQLAEFDWESKRIIRLAVPFATQALSTGILDMITVAVISNVLGTKAISAFVTVRGMIDISSSFLGAFHESIATLCSQARGHHNLKLVGQYVQLSAIFYVVCYIPFIILWWIFMPSILMWLGFDEETALIGQEYSQVYLFLELLDGVDEAIHGLLDVIDLESYSTLVGVSQELITFLDILFITLFTKPSLYVIAWIELFVAIVFIAINIGTIIWRGWFEPYREGLIGSCALRNKSAVKMMLSTSSSLSLGYLLTNGEWEILTFFASYLGPAEGM
jgi:MatE